MTPVREGGGPQMHPPPAAAATPAPPSPKFGRSYARGVFRSGELCNVGDAAIIVRQAREICMNWRRPGPAGHVSVDEGVEEGRWHFASAWPCCG